MKPLTYILVLLGVLTAFCGPVSAQTPGTPGPNCLFPLACPGPVPPKPEPLLGPPEEQVEAPLPADHAAKHRRHLRKKAAKTDAQ